MISITCCEEDSEIYCQASSVAASSDLVQSVPLTVEFSTSRIHPNLQEGLDADLLRTRSLGWGVQSPRDDVISELTLHFPAPHRKL